MNRKTKKLLAILSAGDSLWLRALRHGVAAGVEHKPVLESLACRTVIDIGANRGQFALAARKCFSKADIISFESLAAPARVFERIFANDRSTQLHQTAIGPERKTAEIYLSAADPSSSLLPITALQDTVFPGTACVDRQIIRVAPLSDYLISPPPILLKIDVQGYELPCLAGCEALFDAVQYIYVECSFLELYEGQALAPEVIDYLHGRGFALAGVYNLWYDACGLAVQADLLFRLSDQARIAEES